MERPSLSLCLLGFDAPVVALVGDVVRSLDARWRPQWRVLADAQAQAQADAYLLSAEALAQWQERAQASATELPVAHACLSLPAQAASGARVSTDGSSGTSAAVLAALLRLELLLRRDLGIYRLGAQVFRRYRLGLPLRGEWHLGSVEKLVARVDFDHMNLVMDASATLDEIARSGWHAVPDPTSGHVSPVAQAMQDPQELRVLDAMWLFARYCPENLLPMRYRLARYGLLDLPPMPAKSMSPAIFRVLQALGGGTVMNFKELAAATGLSSLAQANALAGLCFAGALSLRWSAPVSERGSLGGDSQSLSSDSVRASDVGLLTGGRNASSLSAFQELRSWLP